MAGPPAPRHGAPRTRAPGAVTLAVLSALAAVAAITGHAGDAAAAPTIAIKARTQLHLDNARRGSDGSVITTGVLRDRLTGEGLAGQRVVIVLAGGERVATTGSDGRFGASFPPAPSPLDIRLQFAGEDLLDPATLDLPQVEIDKDAVALTVTATPTPGGVRLSASAAVGATAVTVPLMVLAGPAEGDDLRPLGLLPPGGRTLTRAELGGPGRRRARVTFAGDDTRARAEAETTFELTSPTTTTLELARRSVAFEATVRASGQVRADDNAGVARAPVAIVAGDRRLAQAVTDAAGNYKVAVEAKLLGAGQHGLQAVVEPTSSFVVGSRSPPVVVTVAGPEPAPNTITVMAFVLTAVLAGGFVLARSRSWRRALASRTERVEAAPEVAPLTGGMSSGRPSLMSTLRRVADHGFAGVVRDAVRHRPLAGALVRLRLPDGAGGFTTEQATLSDADGRFELDGLAVGEWQAKVGLDGHVSERFTVTVPHRGELRDVRIDLVPVRERVFALYRAAAEPVLPEARLWGVWSPRQIVDHVRRHRPSPALGALTDLVEEAYFSARHPNEDLLPTATAQVERAVREAGGPAARSQSPPAGV